MICLRVCSAMAAEDSGSIGDVLEEDVQGQERLTLKPLSCCCFPLLIPPSGRPAGHFYCFFPCGISFPPPSPFQLPLGGTETPHPLSCFFCTMYRFFLSVFHS